MANKRDETSGKEQKEEQGNPAAQAGESAERGARAGREATERAGQQGQEMMATGRRMAERGMQQASEIGRQQTDRMRNLLSAQTRAYREVAEDSREDVEAIIQSSARLAKGVQDLSWEMMNYTQQSLRMGLRAANDLMECRSVEDMVEVQRDYVRETVDTFLEESARLLRLSSDMANEAVTPIDRRVGNGAQQEEPERSRGGGASRPQARG